MPSVWQWPISLVNCQMQKLIVRLALISLTFFHQCLCVGGEWGKTRRGHYVLRSSCSCSTSKRKAQPQAIAIWLNGSELVGCWGSEYKGFAPDTMPGRCSTCDSIQMHTGVRYTVKTWGDKSGKTCVITLLQFAYSTHCTGQRSRLITAHGGHRGADSRDGLSLHTS